METVQVYFTINKFIVISFKLLNLEHSLGDENRTSKQNK